MTVMWAENGIATAGSAAPVGQFVIQLAFNDGKGHIVSELSQPRLFERSRRYELQTYYEQGQYINTGIGDGPNGISLSYYPHDSAWTNGTRVI
jgi:hypothetical protein